MNTGTTNLCIYHGGCTDGVAAAWAVWARDPDFTFFPGVYQDEPPWELIEQADEIVLVDFSYKAHVMHEIAQRSNRKPLVLDHHEPAQAHLEPLFADGTIEGVFDQNRCGALIAWDYFHPDTPRPELLEIIDVSDRRAPGYDRRIKGIILAVRTRPHAPENPNDPMSWEILFNRWRALMHNAPLGRLETEGEVLLDYYEARVDEHVAAASLWALGSNLLEVPMVNAPYYLASDVAGELAKTSPLGVGGVYWITSGGEARFEIRSCPTPLHAEPLHVGKVCEAFAGGGGHHQAAGFKVRAHDLNFVDRVVWAPTGHECPVSLRVAGGWDE